MGWVEGFAKVNLPPFEIDPTCDYLARQSYFKSSRN